MYLENKIYPKSTAMITHSGILHNGIYYSCREAIREFWYTRALLTGTREVTIFYDPHCSNYIMVVADNIGIIKAYKIEHTNSYDTSLLNQYYKRINDFKKNVVFRKNKKQKIITPSKYVSSFYLVG